MQTEKKDCATCIYNSGIMCRAEACKDFDMYKNRDNYRVEKREKKYVQNDKFTETLIDIAYYNDHVDFLEELMESIMKSEEHENYPCPIPVEKWGSEEHFFWMILVGLFGDFGTSIRSGWIDSDKKAICAMYLMKIISDIKYRTA